MIESLIIGVGGMVVMMVVWLAVQRWWKTHFTEYLTDDDVLAGRSRCGSCGCSTICKEHKELLQRSELKIDA